MFLDFGYLTETLSEYGFALTEKQAADLDRYASFLVEYNEKVNLTAITEPNEIVVKHFLDSLLLLRAYDVPPKGKMIDVGTGAGFPSVPVRILRDDIDLTLLDSLNKRVVFLEQLSAMLGQKNLCLHARAEEAGQKKEYRQKYDIATARAVAATSVLAEYCLPFLKVGGMLVLLKGSDIAEEVKQAGKAIGLLGGELEGTREYLLPGEQKRNILLIRKVRETPANYPRPSAKMAKNPL